MRLTRPWRTATITAATLAAATPLALAAAVWPLASAAAAGALAITVVAVRGSIAPALAAAVPLAAVSAAWPLVAPPAAGLIALALVASRGRTAALAAVAALGCVPLVVAVAAWPVTTCVILATAGALLLAWRAPYWALAIALVAFGFEGSLKLLLLLEPTPLPTGAREVGAAALDVALFAAILGVIIRDRGATPRLLWGRMTTVERALAGVLGAWLALSVVQALVGGDPSSGLSGLRLFQSYIAVAVAMAIVMARMPRRAAVMVLAAGAVVGAYAAARVVIGPAGTERAFATSVDSVTAYGQNVRAVGSFSSAVGMTSYLTAATVFAAVVGLLVRDLRRLAWVVTPLGLVAIVASYGRAPLFGIAAAFAFTLLFLAIAGNVTRRARAIGVALMIVVLAMTYGGLRIASQSSPQLRERAQGVLNPFDDASIDLRVERWRRTLDDAVREPLGDGVGTVGGSSMRAAVTTDNSFLLVLVEQGVVGAVLFFTGLFGLLAVITRRLFRSVGEGRAVGLAALAGFVAFLVLAATGEYVQQPGKVVAWALLGIAACAAFRAPRESDAPAGVPA